mmetsp:Transcript_6060/g.14772  ORF Transcript_6060/g.14772 Transcript_6060/m.14772 type:complete len:105 (+) Transcript_6060:696-1010(+)
MRTLVLAMYVLLHGEYGLSASVKALYFPHTTLICYVIILFIHSYFNLALLRAWDETTNTLVFKMFLFIFIYDLLTTPVRALHQPFLTLIIFMFVEAFSEEGCTT